MNWYYVEQGQQVGPVTEEQLQGLFQSGRVTADTLVWREGLPDWVPYHQVSGQLAPPPIQPSHPAAGSTGQFGAEGACSECGKVLPASEMIRIGNASVCAACKPIALQKLSEGARLNTGELNYARVLTRFGAVFIDGLILGAFNIGTNTLVRLVFFPSVAQPNGHGLPAGFLALQFILMAINIAVGVCYEGIMVGKYGATVGKMACKIKVVTADGGKVSYGRAFGRYFAKLLSGFTCAIGYIIALFDKPQRRALHDHICNTRVVEK